MKTKTKPKSAPKLAPKTEIKTERDNIDVVDLLHKADFVPDDVVAAAARNTVFFVRACEYRLACMKDAARAKLEKKRIRAEVDLETRHKASEAGEKTTETQIKSLVDLDFNVVGAERTCDEAEIFDEYSKLVVEVFRMRRDCLRIVRDVTRDEMGIGRDVDRASEDFQRMRDEVESRFPGGRS